MLNDDKINPLY